MVIVHPAIPADHVTVGNVQFLRAVGIVTMSTKLMTAIGVVALTSSTSFLLAQIESTLPKKSAQPREAIQPSTTTAPALKPKSPLAKPPRLTDGATDEDGNELEPRDDSIGPTEVLTNRRTTSVQRTRNPDMVMATWIAIANHEEIALAEVAADRAESPAVREFAATMVKDHQTALSRLRAYAPLALRADYLNVTALDPRTEDVVVRKEVTVKKPIVEGELPVTGKTPARVGPVIDRLADGKPPEPDLTPSVTRTDEDRPRLNAETSPAPRVEVKTVTTVARDFNVGLVERELAAQSVASSKQMLMDKTGPDFDEWFLAQQIGMHKAMRDKLIIYQRYVSSGLGKVLAEAEVVTAEHLAQASDLLDKVSNHVPVAPLPKR
jgi:predicted outer membrane protein